MHDRLRQQWRDRMGKAPEPTAAIIDAQSTRSTAQGGNTGFDAGKKVKGRKRHLVVDPEAIVVSVRPQPSESLIAEDVRRATLGKRARTQAARRVQ